MTGAERIAAFAADTLARGLPEEVETGAALRLLDALGVGIAAATVAENAGWAGAAAPGPARLLSGGTAEPGAAAMLNGAFIHALEYDDTHVGSVVHGSAVAAPLALAVAEMTGASGRDLLATYAVVWEVAIRIGLAAPGAFQARGFQATSVGGAIGAAAAAAALMAPEDAVSAIGIAGGQASGTLAFLADGAMSKALNPGWAARTGIDAARMARAGMTGPASVLESDFGVMQAFADGPAGLEAQLDTLGTQWLMPAAAYKLYPCCHYIHPFLEVAAQIAGQGVRASDVVSATAYVPPPMAPLICEPWARRQSPASGYDGKWGLAYCIALMLAQGRVGVADFEAPPRADVVALAQRISWQPMEGHGFPARFAARVVVETSGNRHEAEVEQVLGGPGRPVGRRAVLDKFAANAGRRYAPADAEALAEAILGIAAAEDVQHVTRLLAG